MNKRKTSCDLSKLLVATLFRLETEIQEAMLRPERRVPTKSTVSLCNRDNEDKAGRGKEASIAQHGKFS